MVETRLSFSPEVITLKIPKLGNFNDYTKGYVERIRNLIPKDALQEERKVLEYGSQQSLVM